ncbi:glycerophosphodiester phosphodiesterase family protein [Kordiimonas gwangyangensis]|nr:glycerophosphodiester phosphodiesterase family protein [Kordiimonas gwangyangensis]
MADNMALKEDGPIVIAHRGGSGYRPEHTLMSYKVGLAQGADYIEPDLVMSKDGHLVARHDVYLSHTTDIADHPEFADRKRTLEGHEDWYVFDFTLAELKTLKAIQPRPGRGQTFDGLESIVTFDEIIAFMKEAKANGEDAGLYVEMKRPELFIELGLDPTDELLAKFDEIISAGIPFYFQCFNADYIAGFQGKTDAALIWLIEGVEKGGQFELEVPLAMYADKVDGIGINKALLVDKNMQPSGIVADAHKLGLKVHIWTVRNDEVPHGIRSVDEELKFLFAQGIDGVFADFPDTAILARNSFRLMTAGPGEVD